jgi:hypothetical protein
MKKGLFSVVVLMSCITVFCGCIKNTPYVTTINPSMTATIGSPTTPYNFVASKTTVATLDTQMVDTSHTLIITGTGSDPVRPFDKIVIAVASYKNATGTYSMIQGQAGAYYVHSGIVSQASGGVVSITSVSSTVVSGYYSFNTIDGIPITNGKFVASQP